MIKTFKIELKPNLAQVKQFVVHCGVARYAYNWTLQNHILESEKAKTEAAQLGLSKPNYPKTSASIWYKQFAKHRDEEGYEWIKKSSKWSWQCALINLEKAFDRFFKKTGSFPKEKKRGRHDSFTVCTTFAGYNYIKLPKIGVVRLKEFGYATDKEVKVTSITISREADRWFCSFYIRGRYQESKKQMLVDINDDEVVGIDLGIKDLAITSDGQVFKNPKAYKKHKRRLARLQRKLARQTKGSKSRNKTLLRLQRLHRRIKNIRKDSSNKMTSSIVNTNPKMIVIEGLKPKNMSKNRKLAASILDASFGEIGQQFSYKSEFAGVHLVKAPMFYPSSQFCHVCGYRNRDLKLIDREWVCPHCGRSHDRDFNAAKNLQYYGLFLLDQTPRLEATGSFPGCNASGDERLQFLREQCSSEKQEFRNRHLKYLMMKD